MQDQKELRAWLALLRADHVGAVSVLRLISRYGSASVALDAGARSWRAEGFNDRQCQSLSAPDEAGIAADLKWLGGNPRRHIISYDDPRYPPRLRAADPAPPLLFCQGDVSLLQLPQLAIVGARNATPQGLDHARDFAAELSRRGLVITSGLAQGVDGAAHEGALDAGGLTLAVCGTGLDRVYPPSHRQLAHRIGEHGLLVSEFPAGTQSLPENFPRRNRIISALALGVLVAEAAKGSGSLITARYAMEQGREVFAIPGSVHNPLAHGCHALIRQGAKLTENVNDILEEIGPQVGALLRAGLPEATVVQPEVGELHRRVLQAMGDRAVQMDQLVEATGLRVEQLSAVLLELELLGLAAPASGGQYMRR